MPAYSTPPNAAELAAQLTQALAQERIVQRFVDSYVVENGRHALQVHAPLYRDLITLLQRESLIAATISLLENVKRWTKRNQKACAINAQGRHALPQKISLFAGTRENWNAGDALDFRTICRFTRAFFPATPAVAVSRSNRPIIPLWTAAPSCSIRLSWKSPRRRHPRSHGIEDLAAHVTDRTAAQPEAKPR